MVVMVGQRYLNSRTAFYDVMIARHSSRRGCPLNTQGRAFHWVDELVYNRALTLVRGSSSLSLTSPTDSPFFATTEPYSSA